MNRVAIIDYGMCNLDSVARAIEECGAEAIVTSRSADIKACSRIILPGVGAFPDAMQNLQALDLPEILSENVLVEGVPFLGICLGMQLMGSRGFEGRETAGIGWIEGEVKRLEPTTAADRIPHIGWSNVEFCPDSKLFSGIDSAESFYFVHSYHLACRSGSNVVGTTDYCGGFVSSVSRGATVFGVQFHPEKSQRAGFRVLRNFLAV